MSNLKNIQGLWKSEGIEDESRVYDEEIFFFGDQFVFIQRDRTAPPVGVESGKFAIRDDGKIDLFIEFDGMWRSNGARDGWDNGPPPMNMALSFNTDATFMTLDGVWDFSRINVINTKQKIEGVWSVSPLGDLKSDYTTYLVFLEDGTYLSATPTDQISFSAYSGLEIGSYEVSAGGTQLSLSYTYDGATADLGSSGFSAAGFEFELKVVEAGIKLTSPVDGSEYLLSNVLIEESSTESSASLVNGTYSLTIVVELFDQVFLLKDLEEIVSDDGHSLTYEGIVYSYEEVEPYIMPIARDQEFTEEFASEIAESFPNSAGVSYAVALGLIGTAAWEQTLLTVAGADGNYIA